MKKLLVFLFLAVCSKNVFAQPSEFSKDSVKFLNQVTDYLGDEDKTTAKEFKKKFRPVWSKYSVAEQEAVVNIANGMLAKGIRPFPEFYDYMQSLYGFKITNQPASSFKVWVEMLNKLIQAKDRKQLPDFLKMSGGLFTQGVIYETNAIKWRCISKDYQFEYDKQPKIVFKSLDLVCIAKGDSSTIYNTSGVYSPVSTSWEGKGGKVTWERLLRDTSKRKLYASLDTSLTYAELKRYKCMFKTPGFDADSVLFHTPYFKKPLAGELIEKVAGINKTIGIRYPQFSSYSKRLFIKDFYPSSDDITIDYEGGFTMQGADVVGSGTSQQMAKIIFNRQKKKFLSVGATNLILNDEDITTDRAVVTFYIDRDSVYHPGINFKYIKKEKKVTVLRVGQGVVMSPFYDTYHQLEIASEALYWKLDEPLIEFTSAKGGSKTDAQFSSFNYFIPSLYDNIQGLSMDNPLYYISDIAVRKDTMVIPINELATHMHKITEDIIPLMYELTTLGLVFYDNETGMVTVKDKLKTFSNARAKKSDYDPIIFESDMKGPDVASGMQDLDRQLKQLIAEMNEQKRQGHDIKKLQADTADIRSQKDELVKLLKKKGTSNASLNLANLDLTIRGVVRLTLSDSQFVRVYPFNQEFVVKKNRDFIFSGVVNAGSTEFFGNNFSYDYAENKINLPQADSMRLRVMPFGARKGASQIRVTSVIRKVRGTISIDAKDNKAGNKRGNAAYPILDCVKESYVYYNKKSIYKGVYDSSKFFFKVAPFKMDSLDNFKTTGVNFAGDFYSAGILPPIKESLKVQKDYSLGFIRKAPPEGFSLYGDKAKFNNDIRLSDKGLQADGELNYLTTFAESKDFVLFPDSITGIAQKYENREQLGKKAGEMNVPKITGKDVYVCFVPKKKVFYASTVDASMKTYGDQSDFRGKMILRPEGLTARGRFIFGKADLKGKVMKCKSRTIDSDTADFRIKSIEDPNSLSIDGPGLNAHIDFDQRMGEFKKNDASKPITLGEIQYICYMDRFKWFMDNENIQLESGKKQHSNDIAIDTDLDLAGSNFFSIHKDQDSLNFMAPKARYDIKGKTVYCEKVEYVTVADARIFPDSNKVTLHKNADMDEFRNAKIVANYITKYHSIFNAKVKVLAKRKYKASGDYTYIDENNFEEKIHFDNIAPDSTFQTYAKGEVSEKEKFALSPNFEYKGKVILKAADIGLNFDGYTRIAHTCKEVPRNWFNFKAVIDPKDIIIPIDKDLLTDAKKPIGSGIYVNLDTTEVYPYAAFLSEKQNPKNQQVMAANGFLVFDKTSQEYRVGSLDKLKDLSLPGNYISLHKEKCNFFADGSFDLLGESSVFKLKTAGSIKGKPKEAEIKVSMLFDFPMNDNVMEKWANKIVDFPDLETFDPDNTPYFKAVREIVGLEEADKIRGELSLSQKFKKGSDPITKSLFLADVTLKWNPYEQMYVSTCKIGVGNIFKTPVFKYVKGVVTIKKERRGKEIENTISVYLQLDEAEYMTYVYKSKSNTGEIYFANPDLNKPTEEAKPDKLKFKGASGEKDYEYQIGKKSTAVVLRGLMVGPGCE